ncbi:DNA-binding LacI/PurR family transcriptional regulator [Actinoplanes lutulentus]|uniref:LacI family transcriptional regulator n=1 Tax=Actinoplanes lutulentus TaxID=1287878 RepID=A0A327Z3Z1_9ACTN|nr:LacI family DNA-binding transcriptional regulator [Actinoplanes lutulentus]MBB2948319.1 DNA-binding LacI/PurR family transcriptional regulator [Actinoplanes lutulentus]RAK30351.1 LacI family transcriptional regulator [Actinoplanes lutulentus]
MKRDTPQIRDVAAAAGVSYQTVSRVLNNSPNVRPDTRQIVLDAMERLQYRPNRAARALGRGRAGAVTVVTANTTLYGYAGVLQGVEEAGRLLGLTVGVRVVASDAAVDVRNAVEYVTDPSCGNVVVVAFDRAGSGVLRAMPDGVPMVAATEAGGLPGVDRPMIFLDERQAAADATRHLLGLGHRTVHHVAIPSEVRDSARQSGWRLALEQADAEVPEVLPAGWDLASAHAAGKYLANDSSVTAILCGNDDTALAVRRALHEAGRDVPGDVSIVGFDDVPGAAYWTPALTTVRMDFVALGRACVAAVVEGAEQVRLDPPSLVIRESTAAPRG